MTPQNKVIMDSWSVNIAAAHNQQSALYGVKKLANLTLLGHKTLLIYLRAVPISDDQYFLCLRVVSVLCSLWIITFKAIFKIYIPRRVCCEIVMCGKKRLVRTKSKIK